MEDDLFDILGISMFASGGAWCSLKNMPCIPLSSCNGYTDGNGCGYMSAEYDEDDENANKYSR